MASPTTDSVSRLAVISAAASYVDHALAVACGVPHEARLLNLEHSLARFVKDDWTLRSRMAADAVASSRNAAAVHGHLRQHAGDVGVRAGGDVRFAYRIGRHRAARRLIEKSLRPVRKAGPEDEAAAMALLTRFDTADEAAMAALEQQLFWVGGHYNAGVDAAVEQAAREVLEQGRSAAVAGATLRSAITAAIGAAAVPAGFHGGAALYFEGVVSAAVQAAHNFGQLATMMRAGEKHYIWHTVEDERVCPVCGHMHGKVFRVDEGIRAMARSLAAATPEALKLAAPWPSIHELLAVSPSAGHVSDEDSAALVAAGFSIPPAHGRCRCLLDVEIV